MYPPPVSLSKNRMQSVRSSDSGTAHCTIAGDDRVLLGAFALLEESATDLDKRA